MSPKTGLYFIVAALLMTGFGCNAVDNLLSGDGTQPTQALATAASADSADNDASSEVAGNDSASLGAGSSGAQCLLGSWEVVNESYLNFLRAASGDLDEGRIDQIDGFMRVTFDEAGMVTNESEIEITICSAEGCIAVQVGQNGTAEYTADDGELSISGGQLVTATFVSPLAGASGSAETEAGSAQYGCSGDYFTVSVEDHPPLEWGRVP